MEECEKWTQLVGVVINIKCPQCRYKISRLIVLRQDEAEVLMKVFEGGFVQGVEVQILRGEELIDWVRGRR